MADTETLDRTCGNATRVVRAALASGMSIGDVCAALEVRADTLAAWEGSNERVLQAGVARRVRRLGRRISKNGRAS